MRKKKFLVADLLCGAGGSSTGALRAMQKLGLDMELVCLNHWSTAIETHQKNHPEARHYVQDIATVRPHLIVPEGYLDLLMASPTCTHHSVARGGKPTSDQQRSDPWHIITWLTELRVKRIIIENVWEFISWGPVDHRTGKPVRSRKGEYFHAWIETIKRLGFEPEWRKLNAADYGGATTRQRFILMARSDRRTVRWPMPTHRKSDEVNGDLFSTTRPWRPAADIIDWSIKGKSILNRKKPLAPKTLARILAGAFKFGWPEPFILRLMGEIERSLLYHIKWTFDARNRKKPAALRKNRRALTRDLIARLRHFRLAPAEYAKGGRKLDPMLITLRRNGGGSSLQTPIPTIAANGQHIAFAEPVIVSPRHGKEGAGPRPRGVNQPLPTITAGGSQMAIAEPVIINMKGKSTASSARQPLPTQTAHAPHLFAAEAILLSQHNSGAPRTTKQPLPTISTGGAGNEDRPGCARPMLVTVAHGNDPRECDPNSRRSHCVDDPLGAIHGDGSAYALVEPFMLSRQGCGAPRATTEPTPTQVAKHSHILISPYYGGGSGETCTSADIDPLPTATAKARFGMVVPITHTDRSNRARDVDQHPLPTLTTANRGELALVESDAEFDILFRMLEPHELAAAMGFNTADSTYEFAGTKTEKIKQIGNAVSVEKMEACVGAIMADAAPKGGKPAEYLEAAE